MVYELEKIDRTKAVALAQRFYACWGRDDVTGMSDCLEQTADNQCFAQSEKVHFRGRSDIVTHRSMLLPPGSAPIVLEKIVCSESGKEVVVFWHCVTPAGDHCVRGVEWFAMNPSATAIASISSELNPIAADLNAENKLTRPPI